MSKVGKKRKTTKKGEKRVTAVVNTHRPGKLGFERRMYGVNGAFCRKWEAATIMHSFVGPFVNGLISAKDLQDRISDCMRRAFVAGSVFQRIDQKEVMVGLYAEQFELEEQCRELRELREQNDDCFELLEAEVERSRASYAENIEYLSAIVNSNKRDDEEYRALVAELNALRAERNQLQDELLEARKSNHVNATRAERAEQYAVMSVGLDRAWQYPSRYPVLVPQRWPFE